MFVDTPLSTGDDSDRADVPHIACRCQPHITACGRLHPAYWGTMKKADGEPAQLEGRLEYRRKSEWCNRCLDMWRTVGCGICSCSLNTQCEGCAAQYQAKH